MLVRYKYDAYGKPTITYYNGGASTAVVKNPFLFRGYYYDSDLQLYYLNSRYYDANTGRFISPDSLEYLGANGDLNSYNLYAYCSNNPVNFADPSGHSVIAAVVVGAVLGLVIGFGATAYSDYEDDGEIFNGSIDVGDYVANSLVGCAVGAVVGYAVPTIGAFMSSTITVGSYVTVGGELVSVTISGAEIVGVATGATMLLASSNRPGNNKAQNKQFRDAMRELGITDKNQMRRVHDKIKGRDMGYNELIEFIKHVLNIR